MDEESQGHKGSGSQCHWISLTTSLTTPDTSEVISSEDSRIGDERMADIYTEFIYIYPAADTMYIEIRAYSQLCLSHSLRCWFVLRQIVLCQIFTKSKIIQLTEKATESIKI